MGLKRNGIGWRGNQAKIQAALRNQVRASQPTSRGFDVCCVHPSAVPAWVLATIVLGSGLLVFSSCFCLYRKRCRRRMGKKSQAQAQVHLQEVKELGRSYIDKV